MHLLREEIAITLHVLHHANSCKTYCDLIIVHRVGYTHISTLSNSYLISTLHLST